MDQSKAVRPMKTNYEYAYEIVNSRIYPIANELIKKYEELGHLNANNILFLVNHKTSSGKKRIILARTRKMPDKWCDILSQLGACPYFYVIEFIGKTTACLDENQMTALVYRELRMIAPEGQIVTPDTNDWWQVLMGLGRHWFYPDSICPDLLDNTIDWKKLMGEKYEPPKAG
jgi:hypothetical protein